jgi:superfamily II DNA or RNA helicase
MKAQFFSSYSIDIITDEKFQNLVSYRAGEIVKKAKEGSEITSEDAYQQALNELSEIYKEFDFTPIDKTQYGEFTSFVPKYELKDGKIINTWEIKDNTNVSTMQNKIAEIEQKIKESDDKIIAFCERVIMGEDVTSIQKDADKIITERNNYRQKITDITNLIDKINKSDGK